MKEIIEFDGRVYQLVGHYSSWPTLRTPGGRPASGWVRKPPAEPPTFSYRTWERVEIPGIAGAAYCRHPWILVIVSNSDHEERYYYQKV